MANILSTFIFFLLAHKTILELEIKMVGGSPVTIITVYFEIDLNPFRKMGRNLRD